MFEVGREYTFRMIEDDVEGTFGGEVIEIDGPLIKLKGGIVPEQIINVTSRNFVSADVQPFRSAEDKAASEAKWAKLGVSPQRRDIA